MDYKANIGAASPVLKNDKEPYFKVSTEEIMKNILIIDELSESILKSVRVMKDIDDFPTFTGDDPVSNLMSWFNITIQKTNHLKQKLDYINNHLKEIL